MCRTNLLYVSPYLVASSQNYTKHYYAGTERVASKIGGGGIADITTPIVSTDYKRNSWTQPYASLWSSCLNLAAPCSTFFYSLLNAQTATSPETALYFYHSDHLGSASWITDSSGSAIQHLQYLPFGERFVDQRTTNWNTRYTFSAKEKDEESEYSYFGARYYDSDLSIWLSVDPMSDKYPYQSPYLYCGNNPLKIIDPNGEDEWDINKEGQVVWKKQSNTHTLYALDKEGNRTGKSIDVKDRRILDQLSVSKGKTNLVDAEGTVIDAGDRRTATSGKNGGEDMLKVFKFAADNTDVEWSIEYKKGNGDETYALATNGWSDRVKPVLDNPTTSIHSHPKTPNNFESEKASMWGDRNFNAKISPSSYVYMPKSTRLFNIKQNSYIRHINGNYKRFINMGL